MSPPAGGSPGGPPDAGRWTSEQEQQAAPGTGGRWWGCRWAWLERARRCPVVPGREDRWPSAARPLGLASAEERCLTRGLPFPQARWQVWSSCPAWDSSEGCLGLQAPLTGSAEVLLGVPHGPASPTFPQGPTQVPSLMDTCRPIPVQLPGKPRLGRPGSDNTLQLSV